MISHPNVKVNLGLSVLRRREDGFHDLETLFLPYPGMKDTLEIIKADEYSLTSASLFSRYSPSQMAQAISEDGKLMITIARAEGVDWNPLADLSAKAYTLLSADFQLPAVKIFLEKTSAVGAGLGGGSADAAFALRMLSELCELGLTDETLAAYAARLGSDCAFFIYNRPMMGEGRGDILSPYDALDIRLSSSGLPLIEGLELRVTLPRGVSVSTKEAYAGIVPRDRFELKEPQSPSACASERLLPLREALALPVAGWKHALVNDFERTVFAVHPQLTLLKQEIYDSGAVYASMSGSGSALFGLYPPPEPPASL